MIEVPIILPKGLPTSEVLKKEQVIIFNQQRARKQDIRPLRIAIVNLMPQKEITEIQLLRLLSQTPLQIEVDFIRMTTYESQNTDKAYLDKFYKTFDSIKETYYDGLIITGAPVETLAFEEVLYWQELKKIMAWSKNHCFSTFHICWGAQAALYFHYGINKILYTEKLSGIYLQQIKEKHPLTRGLSDEITYPQSRYTGIDAAQLAQTSLKVLASSEEIGPTIIAKGNIREVYVLGHLEYDTDTLKNEYLRDQAKNLNPQVPKNYFKDDCPTKPITNCWRGAASLVFANWINELYQETPYQFISIENQQ